MTTPQEVAQKAVDLVSAAPDREMIGARLGALLKNSFPDFNPFAYQAKNLRHFVRLYAPALAEKSHTGMDVLFTVSDSYSASDHIATPAPVRSSTGYIRLPLDLLTWRCYSNPSNKGSVAFNPTSAEIKVVDPAAHISAPWLLLSKPSPDRHLEIARMFVADQSEAVRVPLERVLSLPNWYQQFSTTAKRLNVGSAWALYRITKLSADLETALLALGTPLNALRPASPASGNLVSQAAPNVRSPLDSASEAEARGLAAKAVQMMPLSELRALRLPLGSILDALASK